MRILIIIVLAAWGLIMFEATTTPESKAVTKDMLTHKPVGISQDNPVPLGQSILCKDNFEITVLKTARGQQALNKINDYISENNKPYAGMEYILVTLSVKFTDNSKQPKRFDISQYTLIGNNGVAYGSPGQMLSKDSGKNFTEELSAGAITEMELEFMVSQNEKALVLIYNAAVYPEKPCYLSL